MTWIDYFAEVGGLLGLVLGMGFVTFIEIVWLCLRIALHKFPKYFDDLYHSLSNFLCD